MKHLKKILFTSAAAVLAASALAGCGGGSGSKSDGDTIKIGTDLEMTGNQAAYGQDAIRGAKLAVEEINKNGGVLGKKLELVSLDNKSEPSEAASAAQKLVDEGVVAVVAPNMSSNTLAAVPILDGAKIPSISPGGTNPKITVDDSGKVRPYSYRACFIDPYQGQVMANFVYNKLGKKKVAILIDNSSDYAKGLAKFFTESFTKSGGEIVGTEAYLQKDTDFNAVLTKIKDLNPDFIYVPGYYQEVGLILKQARAMGITVPFGGGDGWDSPTLAEIAGADALNGTYYSNHYAIQEDNKKVMDFVNAYKAANNEDPGVFGALTYDTIYLLAQVIKDAGSADPQKITDGLAALKSFSGVTGDMSFTDTHDAKKAAFILTFKDGKPAFADKISAD